MRCCCAAAPRKRSSRSHRRCARSHDPAAETQLAMALRQAGREDEALERFAARGQAQAAISAGLPRTRQSAGGARARTTKRSTSCNARWRSRRAWRELSLQLGFLYAARNDGAKARAWLTRGLADSAARYRRAVRARPRLTQSDLRLRRRGGRLPRGMVALTPNDAAARLRLGACLLELGEDDAGLDAVPARPPRPARKCSAKRWSRSPPAAAAASGSSRARRRGR